VRAIHRHGARPERARLWPHDVRPGLVFAAIEREVVDAAGQRVVHRYVYEWDLGPIPDLVTPDRAMAVLRAHPI